MGRRRTWTDDDLRAAVDGSSTVAEVVRNLRLSRGGAAYVTVRTRMEQLGLGLEATEAASEPPTRDDRRRWTADDLSRAVAASGSLNEVFARLGLSVGGSQWLVIRRLIRERALPTDHWDRPLDGGSQSEAADFATALGGAGLPELVRRAPSCAWIIRTLGFRPSSSTYRWLRDELERQQLTLEAREPAHAAMRRAPRPRYRRPRSEILVADSTYTDTTTLKRRLVDEGLLAPTCAGCGLVTWLGRELALHLDHVNGVRNDHRLENLRLLCPNCHSQTATFAGRNRGRYASSPPADG